MSLSCTLFNFYYSVLPFNVDITELFIEQQAMLFSKQKTDFPCFKSSNLPLATILYLANENTRLWRKFAISRNQGPLEGTSGIFVSKCE